MQDESGKGASRRVPSLQFEVVNADRLGLDEAAAARVEQVMRGVIGEELAKRSAEAGSLPDDGTVFVDLMPGGPDRPVARPGSAPEFKLVNPAALGLDDASAARFAEAVRGAVGEELAKLPPPEVEGLLLGEDEITGTLGYMKQ